MSVAKEYSTILNGLADKYKEAGKILFDICFTYVLDKKFDGRRLCIAKDSSGYFIGFKNKKKTTPWWDAPRSLLAAGFQFLRELIVYAETEAGNRLDYAKTLLEMQ